MLSTLNPIFDPGSKSLDYRVRPRESLVVPSFGTHQKATSPLVPRPARRGNEPCPAARIVRVWQPRGSGFAVELDASGAKRFVESPLRLSLEQQLVNRQGSLQAKPGCPAVRRKAGPTPILDG